MNELSLDVVENTMTTKEVAKALGVTDRTVRRHAQKMGITKKGVQTLYTEQQCTDIKNSIANSGRNDLDNVVQVNNITTETEENETILKALTILKTRSDLYKQRAEIAENIIIKQAPKVEFYDMVADSKTALSMNEVAKVLDCGMGRNKLFAFLRKEGILQYNNVPYQKYIDFGYFRVFENTWEDRDGETHVEVTTRVYQKGVEFIGKLVKEYK